MTRGCEARFSKLWKAVLVSMKPVYHNQLPAMKGYLPLKLTESEGVMKKLPKDVENRFDEEFTNRLLNVAEGKSKDWEDGYNFMVESTRLLMIEIKQFIAEELDRQRQEYVTWAKTRLEKCNRLVDSEFTSQSPDYFRGKIAILTDVLAILGKARE